LGLDQVIVQDAKDAIAAILGAAILGKAKVEARLEPVLIGPGRITLGVGTVTKPGWIGFGDKELVARNDLDEGWWWWR
jgi:hypothetical protein